jgi:hypothetical protein
MEELVERENLKAALRRVRQNLTKEYFDGLGVPRLATGPQLPEPPDADPHVRWCGRGRKTTIPILPDASRPGERGS